MKFYEDLKWRGLIKDAVNEEELSKELNDGSITCYCGFDPTADSLHIGHLQQIILLRRYQMAGHTPIAVCGGATGTIGDPRPTSERKLLTHEEVKKNVECLKKQLSYFLDFSNEKAYLVNNYDWLSQYTMIDFLRLFGKYFNIATMLAKDTIAKRISTGLSFTEFTYTILQAVDYLTLYRNYNCRLQIGGSDQWGNIVSGMDLIHKLEGEKAVVYGLTSPLITKSDGSKFGKSEGQNIWLDPKRTSPYEFYQFLINIADADIMTLLKRLSFLSKDEIEQLEVFLQEEPHLRKAQKALAEELTLLVHGEEGLQTALKITETLFKGNLNDLTTKELKIGLKDAKKFSIKDGTLLIDALVESKILNSKREARELMSAGSIALNGEKITDIQHVCFQKDAYDNEFMIVKKGKKNYFVLNFN